MATTQTPLKSFEAFLKRYSGNLKDSGVSMTSASAPGDGHNEHDTTDFDVGRGAVLVQQFHVYEAGLIGDDNERRDGVVLDLHGVINHDGGEYLKRLIMEKPEALQLYMELESILVVPS